VLKAILSYIQES